MYLITQLCHTLLGKYMGYKGKRSIEKNLLTMVATKIDREEQNKKIHIRKVYRVLNSSLRSSHFIICSISLQKSTTCFKITWGAQQNTETWGLSYTYRIDISGGGLRNIHFSEASKVILICPKSQL